MINILNKNKCCGCGACSDICPENAISMVNDEKGFMYPECDALLCANCGACVSVCAFSEGKICASNVMAAYAVHHKSKEVLYNSSSGGVFTAVSDYVLMNGGYVYGAIFDYQNKNVRHVCADNQSVRNVMRGSKYVQSITVGIYKEIAEKVSAGKLVLFTGTPCQCAELVKFIGSRPQNLIVIDFLCHGVPSPLLFREHIYMWEKKTGKKAIDFSFRSKKYGYDSNPQIIFEDGKENTSVELKRLLKIYAVSMRESCYYCPYASKYRYGDISIADMWEAGYLASIYDNVGVSTVLVNTDLGQKLVDDMAEVCKVYPVRVEDIKQSALSRPVARTKSVDDFWDYYFEFGYEKTLDKFGRSTLKSKIYQHMLRILYILRLDRFYIYFVSKVLKR